MFKLVLILLTMALLFPRAPAFAQQAVAVPNSTGTAPATTSGTISPTVPAPTSAAATSPSINPASNTAQQSQSGAAAMNAAAAAALMAACMMTKPPNMALCAMGALAAMQAAQDAGDSGDSGNSATASSSTPAPSCSPTPTPAAAAPTGTDGFNNPTVAAGQQALADAGYTVTPDTVTSPDGTTTPASSFGSSSGMANAGFSADQIKAAQKTLADVNSKLGASVAGLGIADGAGGGGGNGPAAAATALPALKLINPFALNNKAKQQLVAGKTVLFDGEPIGVRGDNIFDMIHSAYARKRLKNSFIETTSTDVRTPASSYVPPPGK